MFAKHADHFAGVKQVDELLADYVLGAETPISAPDALAPWNAHAVYPRRIMDEKEPTQRTEQGHEIPVPKRGDVDRVLERAAQPISAKPKRSRRRKGSAGK